MSKLAVKPLFSGFFMRRIASSMVRPITKISPIIRIAAPTAWRTNGSPARDRRRLSGPASPSPTSARPTTRPQVAELTSFDADRPVCARQSASPSLSAISRSAVSGSGTRRNASARLSSATPSDELRRYSWRNWFTQPRFCAARRSASSPEAWPMIRSRASGVAAARSSSGFRTSGSGARYSDFMVLRASAVTAEVIGLRPVGRPGARRSAWRVAWLCCDGPALSGKSGGWVSFDTMWGAVRDCHQN